MLKTTNKTIKTRTNSCKNLTQTKRRREDEMRRREKMNHRGGGGGFYTIIFSTELPTDNRIIFFWVVALNSVGDIRWYLIDFRTKILKIPPDFRRPSVIAVGNCVSEHARIGFAAPVGNSVSNCADN
jgi:hypothetical protein